MYELKHVTPESEGIPSDAVVRFIDKVTEYRMNIHSFAFIRRGNVAAEAYAKPFFDENFNHRLYSCSKSFVSLAIGKLVRENKVKLTDKICSYFTEFVDENTDEKVKETTIEDMLEMSVSPLTDSYALRPDLPWAESFFKVRGVKPSGTVFDYNSSGSFVLGALVEKLTGKTFIEYLRPEFDEIGVSGNIRCVTSPDGYAWGASGVICTLRDFAKVCLLVMNKGEHNGKRLLPSEYIAAATSKQIANYTRNDYTPRKSRGYGYQFWITDKGYSMYGMGSQYAFFFPDKDFLFVCNGDTQVNGDDFCGEFLYEWVSEVYDRISTDSLPESNAAGNLEKRISEFGLPKSDGDEDSDFRPAVDGAEYELEPNDMGIKHFALEFCDDGGTFVYENKRGVKRIKFGMCRYERGTFPETNYYSERVSVPSGREFDCVAAAEWVEKEKLLIRIYVIDNCMGNLFITLGFKGDDVGIEMNKRAEFFLDDYDGFACGHRMKRG